MTLPTSAKQWILTNPPIGDIVLEGPSATFQLKTEVPLPDLKNDEVLLQVQYLSNDPAQRTWIWQDFPADRHYTTPVVKGEVMRVSRAICKVLASKSQDLKEGAMVTAPASWSSELVVNAQDCMPIRDVPGLSITHFLGAFSGTGLTAMYGLFDIGRATGDDIVAVSGAAGATGSMVVQLAKHVLGCKTVIGIAGGEKKCRFVESLGADICVDYKSPTFKEDLRKATSQNPTVYFDNVGGEVLDLMLTRIARYGRIVACGEISRYNSSGNTDDSKHAGLKNWFQIVANRLEVKGFIIYDNKSKMPEYVKTLVGYAMDGKLRLSDKNETVVDTKFEDIPKTWNSLFSGANQGKLITHLV